MSLIFSISGLFGLVMVIASIGDDALGLGVAGILILVGAAGKAWVEQRTQKQAKTQNEELHNLIAEGHASIEERLAVLGRDVSVLGGRITELENVVTAPDRTET